MTPWRRWACGLAGALTLACGGPGAFRPTPVPPLVVEPPPPPSPPAPLPPPPLPPPNAPPSIRSLSASVGRMEVGDEVQITAVVEDEETKVEDLTFEWTADRFPRSGAAVVEDFTPGHEASSLALVGVRRSLVSAGTFTGTGPRVRWRPPKGEPTPATYQLKLTVVERYTVTLPGGTETRENRASATVGVDVNDSPNDVADLVLAFLKDFSDSSVPAKICVRYFSEFCPRGRAEELEDIQENRDRYVILSSRHRIDRLTINETFDVADIKVSCEFTSRVIRTGRTEVSRGDCLFMAVYGPRRWGLCESHFQ